MAEFLRWEGYEHEHHEKGADWFWALGIIAVSLALTAVILENILFGVLILAAAGALATIALREPQIVEFEINNKGIKTGDTFHPYEEIKAFWVDTEHYGESALLIDTVRFLTPHLVIPINDVSLEDVREYLQQYIREEELHEPISHYLLEFLGF